MKKLQLAVDERNVSSILKIKRPVVKGKAVPGVLCVCTALKQWLSGSEQHL